MNLIEKIDLPNGLTVELYDCSRIVAGDRWFLKLFVRAPVEVTLDAFSHLSDGDALFHEFLETRGGFVCFEEIFERNFIDNGEKDRLFLELVDRFK